MQKFRAGFVAVIGKPNVGKSTLINELIGQKLTITSPKPQTTRHRISTIISDNDYQLVLVDTPGIHINNKNALNRYMNRAASGGIKEVDVILYLLDLRHFSSEDKRILTYIKQEQTPVICAVNKIDKLKDKKQLLTRLTNISKYYDFNELVPISAFNPKDVAYIKKQIINYLPIQNAIFNSDYLTDKSDEFIISEFIREQLMRLLSNEVPYAATVKIEHFQRLNKLYRIAAKIVLDKPSQKTIIIGKNARMLKKIGIGARKNIENFLMSKIYLKLHVSVVNNWSNDNNRLASFGYKIDN